MCHDTLLSTHLTLRATLTPLPPPKHHHPSPPPPPHTQQGFYGVYSTLFNMLAEQELSAWQASDAAGAPNATPPKFAPFGTSDSPSSEVFAFYNNWGSFVTVKEFAWADLYNPAAAPNRQVRG